MPYGIVVVGASAGGVEALSGFCRGLPSDLAAAVFVVLHVSPASPSMLPHILARCTLLPVTAARDKEPIPLRGIRVAPAAVHLVLQAHGVRLVQTPPRNHHRPAIDSLFESAAAYFGASVLGVLLSGTGEDGVAGLGCIKAAGGKVMVQHPDDALFGAMPLNALRQVDVDYCLPCFELGRVVGRLVGGDSSSS